jgi:hypothetical protein
MELKAASAEAEKDAVLAKEADGSVSRTVKQSVTRDELVIALKTALQNQSFAQVTLDKCTAEVVAAQTQLDSYDVLVKSQAAK